MKKVSAFLLWLLFLVLATSETTLAQNGNAEVYVSTWRGTGAGAGKKVLRYDSLWRYIDLRYTNIYSYAYWSNIPARRYFFEAYDTTGRAIWGTEAYWGHTELRVIAGQTVRRTITQYEPYIETLVVMSRRGGPPFPAGDTLMFGLVVRNRSTETKTSRVYCRVDRNRVSPWDYDAWSDWFNISPGGMRLFTFWFILPRGAAGTYYYTARVGTQLPGPGDDVSDQKSWIGSFMVGIAEEPEKQTKIHGFAIRPNPLIGRGTNLSFSLSKDAYSAIYIYNPEGREVRTLSLGRLKAGEHVVYWDGRDFRGRVLPPGVYFVRVVAGEFTAMRKMVKME